MPSDTLAGSVSYLLAIFFYIEGVVGPLLCDHVQSLGFYLLHLMIAMTMMETNNNNKRSRWPMDGWIAGGLKSIRHSGRLWIGEQDEKEAKEPADPFRKNVTISRRTCCLISITYKLTTCQPPKWFAPRISKHTLMTLWAKFYRLLSTPIWAVPRPLEV